jgi:hypothetical protein
MNRKYPLPSTSLDGKTLPEKLTREFYHWEKYGRGELCWNYPVDVAPRLIPFSRSSWRNQHIKDDGQVPSVIASIFRQPKYGKTSEPETSNQDYEYTPAPLIVSDDVFELQLILPPKLKINQAAAEQFVLSLSACRAPVSFEIVGLDTGVHVQIAGRRFDQQQVQEQLAAHFPEAITSIQDNFLISSWSKTANGAAICEFTLAAEFMRPIEVFLSFEPDPLNAVVAAVASLRDGELGLLQILFQAVREQWADSIVRALTDNKGNAFFKNNSETLALARQKTARPLFAAVIRTAARCQTTQRRNHLINALEGALQQFSLPASNELKRISHFDLTWVVHERDLLSRETHRHGAIVNSAELTSLVHPPSASVRSERLVRESRKRKSPPAFAQGNELLLGENDFRGKKTQVSLSADQRTSHVYVLGVSGTGKSTLVLNMALQDIKAGQGVGVLDPHGELIDKLLAEIPEERHGDVIVLDPSDENFPVGFNILSAHSELEKNLLASDLVGVFRRLSTSWGDQMTSVLGNAVLAFLESTRGGTLADLKRFLVESDYRDDYLTSVTDPEVVYYWTKEFPLLAGKPQAPLLTRLDTFLRPRPIRNMVSQKESRLDFREIMNGRKILLAKLAHGAIGEQNSYLLGTLLVAKLHQLAMGRQEVSEGERPNFYLYIDEFQNFITPSMASILSGARKYHLALCLAHQELRQLWAQDKDVASAVISNPYTRICFRLGDFDAKKLQDGFSTFEAEDLQNLGVGEAIARIERNEYDFNLKTSPLVPTDKDLGEQRRAKIIAFSRQKYAQSREEVEREYRLTRSAQSLAEAKSLSEELTSSHYVQTKLQHQATTANTPRVTRIMPPPLGRGGQQHKYLQNLIKRLAEDKGFHVTIEQQVLAGTGSVDVALQRSDYRIACEISISSTSEYELKNIEKCLAAGFDQVVVLSSEKKTLAKIQKLLTAELEPDSQQRVLCLLPEEFIEFLDRADRETMTTEQTVRGYKVKVNYKPSRPSEQATQRKAVAQVILQALKRLKDES